MKPHLAKIFRLLVIGLLLLSLSGCAVAVTAIGTVASGLTYGAEYVLTTPVAKTTTYEYDQIKKGLLVALCRMQIPVEKVSEIENGEEILANADELKIKIELKEITPCVTRIKVKAVKGLGRDKATASEIVQQTEAITEDIAEIPFT